MPAFAGMTRELLRLIRCLPVFRRAENLHGGAEGVGRATTRAVVASITALVIADMLFSFFLNR